MSWQSVEHFFMSGALQPPGSRGRFPKKEEVLGGSISPLCFLQEELLKVPSSCADVTWALWSHMCDFSRIFRDFSEVLDSWVRFHSWEHHWICQSSFHTWMLSMLLFKAACGDFLPETAFICFFCLSFCLWSLSILRITPAPKWCFYFIFPFSYFFQSIPKNCKEIPVEFFGATCGVWSLLNETFWVLILILQLVAEKGGRNPSPVAKVQERLAILINRIWRRESQAKLPSAPLKLSLASRQKVLPWNAKAANASHARYDLEGKLGETEMLASCGTRRWRKMPNQKPILRHILGDEI